jgi:predicted N-acetyltransferase YhbS
MATIRDAKRSDNPGLLALTALTPMDGEISVRGDRDPDFFRLLERRGPSIVLVAEDDGRIVGCVSAACMKAHVDGSPEHVHYLGDLKVHPAFRRSLLAARLLRNLQSRLVAANADLVVCTAAQGNKDILPFFLGRAGFPRAQPIGVFRVLQILPSRRRGAVEGLCLRKEEESPDLLRLFNDSFRHYQFGPVLEPGALSDGHTWVARAAGEIVAALALRDVGVDRRNVIIGLPFLLNVLTCAARPFRPVLSLANLPRMNQSVRSLYIRALACREGGEDALEPLIRRVRNEAFEGGYHFLTVGVHEKDGMAARLAKYPKFVFKSVGFVLGLKRGAEELRRLARGVPFEDYSLV